MTKYPLAALLVALAGCYSVNAPNDFRCSKEYPQCPGGMVCNGSKCVDSLPDGSVDQAGDLPLMDTGPGEGTAPDQSTDQGSKPLVATIFAGIGSAGVQDGPVATAQFNEPVGLFGDGKGAVYVADTGNHCIRKIENNTVSTVAGKCGTAGVLNGGATTIARFRNPTGILVGPQGQLVVADSLNHCIRKIENNTVSTVAGKCGPSLIGGYKEGPVADAEFRFPFAIMFTTAGDLIVSDSGNNCLRLVKGGFVSTFAGSCGVLATPAKDGSLLTARFNGPSGIWWDNPGSRFVVADTRNNCIRELKALQVTTIAGTCNSQSAGFSDGPATSVALFNTPSGIAAGADGVYISDTDNHRLRRLDATEVATLAGNGSAGNGLGPSPEAKAVLNTPSGVLAVGPDTALVSDTKNHRILLIAPAP